MSSWLQTFSGHYYHFSELPSTQNYLLEHPSTRTPIICIADTQNGGHGQQGRAWQGDQLGQFYASIRYPFAQLAPTHAGLTQYIGLTLANFLNKGSDIISLKWPNDLFINGRKLGGTLIDMLSHQNNSEAVIGIGINFKRYQSSSENHAYYDDAFTSAPSFIAIFEELINKLTIWAEKPYLPLDNNWNTLDCFYGKTCQLENLDSPVTLLGIDQNGRLIAKYNNKVHFLTNTRIQKCIS